MALNTLESCFSPFSYQNDLNRALFSFINLSIIAYERITLDLLLGISLSAPCHSTKEDVLDDSKIFNNAWRIAVDNWEKRLDEHLQLIVDSSIIEKKREWHSLDADQRIMYLDRITLEHESIARVLSGKVFSADEMTRNLINFSISGLVSAISKEPLFSHFRYPQNKGVNKSLEQRMEEELDAELLRKHLDPESSYFIEWKHLMAYVRIFPDHHIQAKNLLESSGTITDLATYIPREIEVRRFIEKLRLKEIDKKNFEAEIARLTNT